MDDMDFGGSSDMDFGGDSGSADMSGDSGSGDMFGSDTGSGFDDSASGDLGGDLSDGGSSDLSSSLDDSTSDTGADSSGLESDGGENLNEDSLADIDTPVESDNLNAENNEGDTDTMPESTDNGNTTEVSDNLNAENTDSETENPTENVESENASEENDNLNVDNQEVETKDSLTDSDRQWLDERDDQRENWTDGEVPQDVTDENLENSTHNPDAESMTLGKYGDGGDDSYINKADDDSTYYSSDNYEDIQDEYHQSDSDMYEAGGNKDFIEQNLDEGKDVQFGHDPREDDGALGEEWDTIQEKTGANDDDLVEGEDGMLHLENKGAYVDEQPLDKHEDEE